MSYGNKNKTPRLTSDNVTGKPISFSTMPPVTNMAALTSNHGKDVSQQPVTNMAALTSNPGKDVSQQPVTNMAALTSNPGKAVTKKKRPQPPTRREFKSFSPDPMSGVGQMVKMVGVGFNTHSFCSDGTNNFKFTQSFGNNKRFILITILKDTINMHDPDTIKRTHDIIYRYALKLSKIPDLEIYEAELQKFKKELSLETIKTAIQKCSSILTEFLKIKDNTVTDDISEFCLFLDFLLSRPNDLIHISVYGDGGNNIFPNKKYAIPIRDYDERNGRLIADTVIAFDLPEIYTKSKIPEDPIIPFSWNDEGLKDLLGEIIIQNQYNSSLPGFEKTSTSYNFTTQTILTYLFSKGYTIVFGYDTGCNSPEIPQIPEVRRSNLKKKIANESPPILQADSEADLRIKDKYRDAIIIIPGYSRLYALLNKMYETYPRQIPWLSGPTLWPRPKLIIPITGGSLNIAKQSRKNTTIKRRKRKTIKRRKRQRRKSRRIRK
jgi:hypothetical protein